MKKVVNWNDYWIAVQVFALATLIDDLIDHFDWYFFTDNKKKTLLFILSGFPPKSPEKKKIAEEVETINWLIDSKLTHFKLIASD